MDKRSWRFGPDVALGKQFDFCFSVYAYSESLVRRRRKRSLHRHAESGTNNARLQCGAGRRYPSLTCVWSMEASDVEK